MNDLDQDYLAREAEALTAASEQSLDNVRQKHLTAAATWAALAQTARKVAAGRASRLLQPGTI